jgi:deoxyribonuclease V
VNRWKGIHHWNVSPEEAVEVQHRLADLVCPDDAFPKVESVCGADVAYGDRAGVGACAVFRFPELVLLEVSVEPGPVQFPYIPGLLSFREIPLLLPAFEKLKKMPDVIIVDGHGLAHPRRFGLACHLGVLLDKPVIGCAKSSLLGCGRNQTDLPADRGSFEYIREGDDVVGAALRTKSHLKPLYISVGTKISLGSALYYVLHCSCQWRVPEPVRKAHQVAKNFLLSSEAEDPGIQIV